MATGRLAVSSIRIGSLRSQVIERLGKPIKIKSGRDEVMGTGAWEELSYRGLVIEVIRPEPGMLRNAPAEPYVARVVITGGAIATESGLRIGAARSTARQILGRPERTERRGNRETWWYETEGFDGRVVLTFRRGRLAEILVEEDWT